MEFTESDDHQSIREAIRKICAAFDDEYWSHKDEAHEFPWEFYNRLGDGPYIASAMGVWGMALLTVTLVGASVLMGRRLGAIFRV